MTVETDSASSVAFLRFFGEADKFAQAYQYRVRAAVTADARAKDPNRLRSLEEDRVRRARFFTIYQGLPGGRRERLKALREIAGAEGFPLGYDAAIFLVSTAKKEIEEAQRIRIGELTREGRSEREIARILKIPVTTVRRRKNEPVKCPRIDDLPPTLHIPSPFPVARSTRRKKQQEPAQEAAI